jgi:plastocyanin
MDDRRRAGSPGGLTLRTCLTWATALALVVGCGGGGESVNTAGTATARFSEGMEGLQGGIERGMPATVTMTDGQQFDPPRVTVSVGTTVLWRNSSAVQHTVTADPARAQTASNVQLPSGAVPFGSESLTQGQTFAQQLTVAGEYRYVCRIHEGSGMVGNITVE